MYSLSFFCTLIPLSWSQCSETSGLMYLEQITEPFLHSEGPHWDEGEQVVYFVDIAGFAVHKYDPATKVHTSLTLNDTVGVVIPVESRPNSFLIGLGREIALLEWDGETNGKYSLQFIHEVDKSKPGNRFNDGKADRSGNLWIGTMGEEKPVGNVKMNQGSLFKLDTECKLRKVVSPVSISNGIAWNRENSLMFYIDSPTRKIDVFDYDSDKGEIVNRRTFFDFANNNVKGVPDGMTIDADDNLWVACWGGSKVIQVSPQGKLVRSVELPVERVTSVAWGGPSLDTLYVTTMRAGLTRTQLAQQPAAGAVFAVTGLPVRGLPQPGAVCPQPS